MKESETEGDSDRGRRKRGRERIDATTLLICTPGIFPSENVLYSFSVHSEFVYLCKALRMHLPF